MIDSESLSETLEALTPHAKGSFLHSLALLLEIEGGYADMAGDPRGKTRWGIPQGRARKHGYEGPMSDYPLREAVTVYRADFWKALRLDRVAEVDEDLAFELFEMAVHVGKSTAIEDLQRMVNLLNLDGELWEEIATDGVMGPQTLAAIESLAAHRREALTSLCRLLICEKGHYYAEITEGNADFEKFIHGWVDERIPIRERMRLVRECKPVEA